MTNDNDSNEQDDGLASGRRRQDRLNRVRDAFEPKLPAVKKEILKHHNERPGVKAVAIERTRFAWSKAEDISATASRELYNLSVGTFVAK